MGEGEGRGYYRILADDPEAAGAVVLFWPVIVLILAIPAIGRTARHFTEVTRA